jgi:ACR3 family arsenite efflux pump ArsB
MRDHPQSAEEIVDHKVKRYAARRALRIIQRQVDEIEQQIDVEKKSARILLPLLLVALLVALVLVFSPQLYRFISHLLNVA